MTQNRSMRGLNSLKRQMMLRLSLGLFLLLPITFSSCYKVSDTLEPEVNYSIQDKHLKELPPPFPPLSLEEKKTAWGHEYMMGQKFAQQLDLYRAITALKRAEFLLPQGNLSRRQEIAYQILFSYYLGKRYEEVIETFSSSLSEVRPSFPPYHDLLLILYTSYLETDRENEANRILHLIECYYPKTADKLKLSVALIDGDLDTLPSFPQKDPSTSYVNEILRKYKEGKKSVAKAQMLNVIIPGGGYLYVGQKQSALTAFLLNGLFIAAAIHFFSHGHTAAGIITTSFEAGWYFGGIYGAGEAAKLYNERLYESYAYPALNSHNLFPALMLEYGF